MNDITAVITSCGRRDLLKRTLNSLFKLNSHNVGKVLITEDSEERDMEDWITNEYGDKVELFFNKPRLGLLKSLDLLYSKVTTPYIYSGEDDFEMTGSNAEFLTNSINILEENANIHQIWIRKDLNQDWIEKELKTTASGVEYRMVKENHCGSWNGFSFNSSIRRMSDYNNIFPNGFNHHHVVGKSMVFSEQACMLETKKFNYRAALLDDAVCVHIGGGRTTL